MDMNLPSLIKWLEKQKPQRRYIYADQCNCLLAQYLKGQGAKEPVVSPRRFRAEGVASRRLPRILNTISQGYPRSFGAALKRARSHL